MGIFKIILAVLKAFKPANSIVKNFKGENMGKYKLTVEIPESYRKHIEILKGHMRKQDKGSVIRELVDEKLASLFSNS
jgi:pyrrolidone-carboxylate peptidase